MTALPRRLCALLRAPSASVAVVRPRTVQCRVLGGPLHGQLASFDTFGSAAAPFPAGAPEDPTGQYVVNDNTARWVPHATHADIG